MSLVVAYISLMSLTTKTVRSIVIALVIALIGLTWLQVMLLGTAHDLEEQSFRSSVQSALRAATERLETTEATTMAILMAQEQDDSTNVQVVMHSTGRPLIYRPSPDMPAAEIMSDSISPKVRWENDTLIYFLPFSQRVRMGRIGSVDGSDSILLDTFLSAGEHRLRPNQVESHRRDYYHRFDIDDTANWVRQDVRVFDSRKFHGTHVIDVEADFAGDLADSGRFNFVNKIVSRLTLGENKPVEERLDSLQLDSMLTLSLTEAGVTLDFAFGVESDQASELSLISDSSQIDNLINSEFRAGLFTRDFGGSPADLILFFPDRNLFLWQQIWPLALAAAFLMAVIVVCFVYTIRTIIDQRRNASLMVDFVNNMTHEFKTPISTVALACEAILREDVIEDREKVARFSSMIQNENHRMRHQTEKILQMAALEEKDHHLKLQPVDIHPILTEAVSNIALRVEARKGEVEAELGAAEAKVMADPIHMAGIINNLLDNSVKYSPEPPRIAVRTSIIGQRLIIKLSDQGVGLKQEDRERIFDKYFRVSSGDVHDVKGFGLGLSYVKLMMAAHHGDIEVDSAPGRGTTIRLSFPLIASTANEEGGRDGR